MDMKPKFDHLLGLKLFNQTLMGMIFYRFVCTQEFSWNCNFIKGMGKDLNNSLWWYEVIHDIPGIL